MNEFFYGNDALQNYFSELIGIIITVILVPVLFKIIIRRKNATKKYFARQLLFKLTENFLEEITPVELKVNKVYYYRKKYEHFYTFFDLISGFRQKGEPMIIEGLNRLESKQFEKKIKKLKKTFRKKSNEFVTYFSNYGELIGKEINKKYIQLDYHIKTISISENKEFIDGFVETWLIIVDINYQIRFLILKGHKKSEITKDSFKEFNEKINASA